MKTIIILAWLSLGLVGCSNTNNKPLGNENSNDSEIVEAQEASVVDAYINLKDFFVSSDIIFAQSAAKELGDRLSKNGMNSLATVANSIVSSSDLEEQRKQFKIITEGLIKSLKANGTEDGVYIQYCPMAFDNTGASWLSISEEIRNPYFGDKMLKCGKVTEEL